jgi:2-phosphosulfolactate phosphatase
VRAAFEQPAARIRFDWGLAGARALTGPPGTAMVVVDVLSFSTTVSVGTDLGIEIFPFRRPADRAAEFAAAHHARLAGGRREGGLSLSPASIRAWAAGPDFDGAHRRLVLPSPNGSSICHALAERGRPVLAGCLRNAAAVAGWLAAELAAGRLSAVAVIAAGERWPDGSLRPAAEDLWGAGAVLHRLGRLSPELPASPEARAAAAAFTAAKPNLLRNLQECASGVELIEDGFPVDVAIAGEFDAGRAAPLLDRGRFRPA